MIHQFQFLLLAFMLMVSTQMQAQRTSLERQSPELGKVRWYRDYEVALGVAEREQKQVLILFQEVPGCATCRNYGHNVLSHPLMVEAIENLFVPLAIFNNVRGKDRVILNQFGEPSWNNPVVRMINSEGENLIPRIAGDYSAITLCRKMKEVLAQNRVQIPEYLNLLEQELAAEASGGVEETYFKMYCFWSGEMQLGAVDGVLYTESGFMRGSEVVKVRYDKNHIGKSELTDYAASNNCRPISKSSTYRVATKDLHYYLQNSDYKYLPLTALQATKINSALGDNRSAEGYLSPKQLKYLHYVKGKTTAKVLFNKDVRTAWATMDMYP